MQSYLCPPFFRNANNLTRTEVTQSQIESSIAKKIAAETHSTLEKFSSVNTPTGSVDESRSKHIRDLREEAFNKLSEQQSQVRRGSSRWPCVCSRTVV